MYFQCQSVRKKTLVDWQRKSNLFCTPTQFSRFCPDFICEQITMALEGLVPFRYGLSWWSRASLQQPAFLRLAAWWSALYGWLSAFDLDDFFVGSQFVYWLIYSGALRHISSKNLRSVTERKRESGQWGNKNGDTTRRPATFSVP
jgi:hypothetical protein